jgi:hypothetical protein
MFKTRAYEQCGAIGSTSISQRQSSLPKDGIAGQRTPWSSKRQGLTLRKLRELPDVVKFSMARGAPLGPEHMKWPSSAKGRTKKTGGYGMWGDNGFGDLGP